MKFHQTILMSLFGSLLLVKEQMIKIFGRDTSLVDKEFVDVVLSNPTNKKKLIEHLNKNENTSVEIEIKGESFSFVSND